MKYSCVCKMECYKQISSVSPPPHWNLLEISASATPMETPGWHSAWFTGSKRGRKRDSPLLLLSSGKPAGLGLVPQAIMGAVCRYTRNLPRWFTIKKLDRITVKFLCFLGVWGVGERVRFCGGVFSTLSLFILITASSESGPLFAAEYLGKKTDFHKRMLWKIPTSALFLLWNNNYLQAKYAEMLKRENN